MYKKESWEVWHDIQGGSQHLFKTFYLHNAFPQFFKPFQNALPNRETIALGLNSEPDFKKQRSLSGPTDEAL